MENIKIGDKFMGLNGLFVVDDIYIEKNEYWISIFHLKSGQELHKDYDYFSKLLLKKVDWKYIKEATEEDYEDVRAECQEIIDNNMVGGFGRINFIDYGKYIGKLIREFPQLEFKIECFGLNVDKREV